MCRPQDIRALEREGPALGVWQYLREYHLSSEPRDLEARQSSVGPAAHALAHDEEGQPHSPVLPG